MNGAAGGVGTFAIQLARMLGAHVTAVDHSDKLEFMRCIGANEVMDYTNVDFTRNGQQYDLILDVVASRSVSDYLRALAHWRKLCNDWWKNIIHPSNCFIGTAFRQKAQQENWRSGAQAK
jgi:NADPH:quinone reductase-like Zn-dependent oxidoreductase